MSALLCTHVRSRCQAVQSTSDIHRAGGRPLGAPSSYSPIKARCKNEPSASLLVKQTRSLPTLTAIWAFLDVDVLGKCSVCWSSYNHFRRFKMPERQAPDVPSPTNPADSSTDDFEKTLKGLYGDHEWSKSDKDYLRETGLI